MKKPLSWIPLWIDPWLFGSTRIELSLEQRAVWVDLLTVAGKDSGFIRANEGIPYPPEQLAGMLQVPLDILVGTIDRCIETGKLTRQPDGTLYVTSWENYSLTAQYRRRLHPPSQTLPQEEEKKRRGEESKGGPKKGNALSPPGNTVSKKGNTEEDFKRLPYEAQRKIFALREERKSLQDRVTGLEKYRAKGDVSEDDFPMRLKKIEEQIEKIDAEIKETIGFCQ